MKEDIKWKDFLRAVEKTEFHVDGEKIYCEEYEVTEYLEDLLKELNEI